MIDIHCHVLPFIDDGSLDYEQSEKMIENSVKAGVTDIFCTPHYRAPYLIEKEKYNTAFQDFQNFCSQKFDIRLYKGQEIKFDESVIKLLLGGRLVTMNSTKCVLVEFDFLVEQDIAEICYSLSIKGYIPIVAHVERYFYANSIEKIEDIKQSGGLIQINSDSVVGYNGRQIKKFVFKLIKLGLVDFIASDYHFIREYTLKKAYIKVSKKFGEQTAKELFEENQKILIDNKKLRQ